MGRILEIDMLGALDEAIVSLYTIIVGLTLNGFFSQIIVFY